MFDESELTFELGLWLSGIESFLRLKSAGYAEVTGINSAERDYMREHRLTHATLIRCSRLNFRLRRTHETMALRDSLSSGFLAESSERLGLMLRDAILLSEGLGKSGKVEYGGWISWSKTMRESLAASDEARLLIASAEEAGASFLPPELISLLENKPLVFVDQAELEFILPQFARILKWLSVVGRMLRDDEPLKPALLIFSRVHEQTSELIEYIDRRLSRFPDEGAQLFGSLDGASYTAALELKKIYNQELVGLVNVRPSPTVYARIETAYSLLNDSFQQIVTGFARLIDPQISTLDLFPNFRIKLDQSLLLREDLSDVLRIVKRAEQDPDQGVLDELKNDLGGLLGNTMRYLFYKDRETIERFGEEIFAAGDQKNLAPILHRFGAYLETLLGQVNMRTVLADHPFEEQKG